MVHAHQHGLSSGAHDHDEPPHNATHHHRDTHGDHDHHDHGGHSHDASGARIGFAAGLTGLFMLAEVAGGLIAGSLALLADAGHMVSDFASLLLAWFGFRIAQRPADRRRTYGFARFSILAAFTNGIALVGVAIWILVEAAMRIFEPHPVLAGPMLWIAVVGLIVNIAAFSLLHGADRGNLNVRGALAHVAGDLMGSVAAIAAALIIMWTGWTPADPLLSALVAVILLRSAWSLIRDSGHVLLEGAPSHVDVETISSDLASNVDGVLDVHHAHLWSLDGRRPMMTLHARIAEGASGPAAVDRIKSRLANRHGVHHATIEIEHEDCEHAGGTCA